MSDFYAKDKAVTRNMEVRPSGFYNFAPPSTEQMTNRLDHLTQWMRNYARVNVSRAREVSREQAELRAAIQKATGESL